MLLACLLLMSGMGIAMAEQDNDWRFIENKGQWTPVVKFEAPMYGGKFYLEQSGFTWQFVNASDLHEVKEGRMPLSAAHISGHVFKAQFRNCSPDAQITGSDPFNSYYNYFQGNDASKWRGGVPAYQHVWYEGLYPNVDMQVYSKWGNVKYDLILQPGADPEQIIIDYTGADRMYLEGQQLVIETSLSKVVEQAPYAYQTIAGRQIQVPCFYVLEGNSLRFSLPEGYNTDYPLVIDPSSLVFCSFSGSTEDNWGYSATYDNDGNLYGAGIVFGEGYPVVTGSYEIEFQGGEGSFACDVAISKFTADGSDLIYSTYLGGGANELPHSLVVDSAGQLIVYGTTGSDDFPITGTAYDDSFGGGSAVTVTYVVSFLEGSDVYITKFNAAGTDIIGSTYIGGSSNDGLNITTAFNYGDHARGEVVTNADGEVFIASCTNSNNLPTTAGAFQTSISGGQDGFAAHFNADLSGLVWCTYAGGTGGDGAYSMKLAPDGTFLFCGGTTSTNFPTTADALNTDYLGGTMDGFVCRLSADASNILYGTYIGTNAYDQTFFVEVDEENNVYVTGQTSGDYPVEGLVYSNPGGSQYISKLDTELSTLLLSTVFGSGTSAVNISPTALLVDQCESVYVAGWGGSTNTSFNPSTGTVSGMPVTPDAFSTTTSGSDFYFIVFKKDLSDLLYATFFGGPTSSDHVDGGTSRFDKKGTIYQAVCASCGGLDDFPTTDGAWSETNNSSNCNLGVIKYEFVYLGPTSAFTAEPTLAGCAPLDVNFTNNSLNAVFYNWDFGDGGTSMVENPSYTYTEPGEYTISLVAEDPESCLPFDTVYATVSVYGYPEALFEAAIAPLDPTAYIFTDGSIDAASWYWTFGDGITSTEQNPVHAYAEPGTYEVCLTVETEFGCPDSICKIVDIEAISILDVPNAFTPNNDGVNDFFMPFNFSIIEYELRIYNRWGELVFITTDPTQGWDGKYNEKEQDIDTYVYTVSAVGEDNVEYFFKGNLTLVR